MVVDMFVKPIDILSSTGSETRISFPFSRISLCFHKLYVDSEAVSGVADVWRFTSSIHFEEHNNNKDI